MLPNSKAPDLHSVRELIYDTAQKHWLIYIDMEKKSLYKMPWELQTQIQSVKTKYTYIMHNVKKFTKMYLILFIRKFRKSLVA